MDIDALEAKLNDIHDDLLEVKRELKLMNGFQRGDHDRIIRLEERVKIFAGVQAGLTLIASTVAAWLGKR